MERPRFRWILLGTACLAAVNFAFSADDPADNSELAELYEADQAVRKGFLQLSPEKLKELMNDDPKRRARVMELYHAAALKTPHDYYRAAMILQHGTAPDHFLLAHELAVVSASRGNNKARWLAAATEDRFLKSIGRKQRFATQYGKDNLKDPKFKIYPVDHDVEDSLRTAMNCPPLEQAQQRLDQLNHGRLNQTGN